jgi:hypothetical protein
VVLLSFQRFSFVSRLRPLRSTATLAASPGMSLTPFAPFRFYLIGRWTFDVGRFPIASISTTQLLRQLLNASTPHQRFSFQFFSVSAFSISTSQPFNFSTSSCIRFIRAIGGSTSPFSFSVFSFQISDFNVQDDPDA